MTDNSFGATIDRPQPRKPWYTKWWGIVGIVMLVLVLSMIVASTLYISQVQKKLASGELTPENLLRQARGDRMVGIVSDDDPFQGPADAPLTIVEFSDFQCPFCAQAAPVVKEILNRYGDQIRFIYRDFPIEDSHPDAVNAALAGACAHEQGKFWELHDLMFANQDALSIADLKRYGVRIGANSIQFNNCLDDAKYFDEVQEDFEAGIAAGVQATPTFFINGVQLQGVTSVSAFEQAISSQLSQP